jgi:hypothetical protein
MNYLKFTQYAYLIAGILFAIDAVRKWETDNGNAILEAIFAAIGIFMFFFRRKFAKKFEERNKNNTPQ